MVLLKIVWNLKLYAAPSLLPYSKAYPMLISFWPEPFELLSLGDKWWPLNVPVKH